MNIASASQSRPQGPILSSRNLSVSSNVPSRRQKFPTSRNFLVFPVQLGQKKSPFEAFPFTSYTTIDLKARHSYDPNLSQEIGEISVNTASYYKQKQNPQHEFIVFSVTANNGMQNFLALDRNVNVPGSSTLLSRSNKNGPPAQDYFHISHYGDMESLINHCAHTTSEDMCTHVEQVVFSRNRFSFAELVVLASTVSESCPSYQLDAANCYWFASLIWECMLGVFEKGMIIHKKNSDDRGRFKGLKIQGNHSNFQQVTQKYKENIVQFTNDVLGVADRRSRKNSAMPHNRPELEKAQTTNTLAPPTESSRPRSISSVVTSTNGSRPQSIVKEDDRGTDRTRATSLCPNKSQDRADRISLNKDLPSLPPIAPAPQPSRSRTHPTDDRRRGSRAITNDHDFLSAPIPETVARGNNRYSDIGKGFEQATAAYNQSSNRPASSYAVPAQKQVQFEAIPARIPDSTRLKVSSLPSRPSSPGSDPNKDRARTPSLPAGSTPPGIQQPDRDSRISNSQSSDEPPRARTTSGLQRLKRALPKLLLPTVKESEDAICESPELSSWTEIESPEYEEDHPYADGASEKLSFIEFPQPPGPPGLPRREMASSPPGTRVAQGHRVHPSRVEYADGSRKRKSRDSVSEDSDSKCSVPRS